VTGVDAGLREELFEFLRIPSVSASSEHNADTRRAAQWVLAALRRSGFATTLIETPGHPVALGEWRGAGASAPTVLVYGHYDVQPPEPLHLWSSPPFEPELREGRIYARGAADNKGQLFVHLKVLERLLAGGGRLPVNVVVLAEGEEEISSPHLLSVVNEWKDRLTADALVISDSSMFAPGLPSILLSLRGLVYFEVRVKGTGRDVHSGIYGGAVPNAATALARMLATLHDAHGRVALPGFYDPVVEWEETVLERLRALPLDDATLIAETGATRLVGEDGYTNLERLWLRPTCDVNGLTSGYQGEGAKTVIPAFASAKVSFRLVPDQDPTEVQRQFRTHIRAVTPPGVQVEVIDLQGGRPWRANPGGPFFEAARRALGAVFGVEPVLAGEGASIPIVADLVQVLGAEGVLVGLALPGANMHAPDEWFPDEHIQKGIETFTRFYEEIPRVRATQV
jgi:acetylornithine deacetylase/succinyl-diaminopimelate desuccinylase-like protein